MIIETFKPVTYKGSIVYVRRIQTHFEYLLIFGGQIYTAHLTLKPGLIPLALYLLKIKKSRYTDKQLSNAVNYLHKMAETTIDHLLSKYEPKPTKAKPKAKSKK